MATRPTGIDDRLDQLREPIVRSLGSTASERYLAVLADRTFLNLWSYPNPYREQKLPGRIRRERDFCDLLVVCDPHVIVFSEKHIGWSDKPVEVAWPRWFRKAVSAAATQLRGRSAGFRTSQIELFLDRTCTVPFPLKFPPAERRKIHRVVVARGATDTCRDYFRGGTGSFLIKPDVLADDHFNPASPTHQPFAIGDIEPNGDFVHVLDEASLDTVMSELDTISDFTGYLDKRYAVPEVGPVDASSRRGRPPRSLFDTKSTTRAITTSHLPKGSLPGGCPRCRGCARATPTSNAIPSTQRKSEPTRCHIYGTD